VLALIDRARNEPRDLYDFWCLTSNEGIRLDRLPYAIREKLEFRNKPCEGLQAAILQKEARLKALCSRRLGCRMILRLFDPDDIFARHSVVSR